MKLYIVVLTICLLTGCQTINEKTVGEGTSFQFYVGTSLRNEKDGIYKYLLKKDGRLEKIGLAAKSNNPSFLALSADRKYLVAVNEISNEDGEGTVESYLITEDSLAFISRSSSGGAHPCFVSVNDEGYVLTANYTGGNLGLLKLDNFGKLSDLLDIQQHSGSGYTDRQKSAHAHSARFDPINNLVIAADLGTNEIWFSHIDTNRQKLIPSYPLKIPMSPGAGPRHMAFHPNGNWLYVVNELDCTVTLLRKDEKGNYQKASSFSTLPDGYNEVNYCADIHISSDGKFVYASNRGHNSIAVFKVIPESGILKTEGQQSTHGEWPRNFALSPDEKYLLAANQNSGSITSFRRDQQTGLLEYIDQIEAPDPVCIVF